MEIDALKVTKRLDSILCKSENQEALQEFLEEFTNQPLLLKDLEEYLNIRKLDCDWLRTAKIGEIWTECYLKKFPMEILAIYEYYWFSQKPVGKGEYERYGVIDLTLLLNYSNSKGFSLSTENDNAVREFFQKEKGTIRNQLYPRIASSGKRDEYSLLNPNHTKWTTEWRMFHIKMRQIAFHFLHWLSERVPVEMKRYLIKYGIYLLGKKWESYPLLQNVPQDEEKIQFFLSPEKTDLFSNDPELEREASEKLQEIITQVNLTHGTNDIDLFVLSFNRSEMRMWMSDGSEKMTDIFRERCCSITS